MQERDAAARTAAPPAEHAPRTGAQGARFDVAVTAFVGVFVLGFAVIAIVLLSRRRRRREDQEP